MDFSQRTLKELRLKHAQLEEQGQRLRDEQATTSAVSTRALSLGKAAKQTQARANDYKEILKWVSSE